MSLPTPIDQLIVDEIARLLAQITLDNGYRTDAGVNVLTEESRGDIDPASITLELIDENETLDAQSRTYRRGKLTLTVDAQIPKGPTARSTARAVLADIRRALSVAVRELPAGITSLEIGNRRIPPREDGSSYLLASVDLTAGFNEMQSVPTPIPSKEFYP